MLWGRGGVSNNFKLQSSEQVDAQPNSPKLVRFHDFLLYLLKTVQSRHDNALCVAVATGIRQLPTGSPGLQSPNFVFVNENTKDQTTLGKFQDHRTGSVCKLFKFPFFNVISNPERNFHNVRVFGTQTCEKREKKAEQVFLFDSRTARSFCFPQIPVEKPMDESKTSTEAKRTHVAPLIYMNPNTCTHAR